MSNSLGNKAEEQARAFLIAKGLRYLDSNYSCRVGELDLIMRDGEYLVFIEVRSRSSIRYGGALASITGSKQKKIIKTAEHYLLCKKIYNQLPCRFDVVTFEGDLSTLEWIKNAFTLTG